MTSPLPDARARRVRHESGPEAIAPPRSSTLPFTVRSSERLDQIIGERALGDVVDAAVLDLCVGDADAVRADRERSRVASASNQ